MIFLFVVPYLRGIETFTYRHLPEHKHPWYVVPYLRGIETY